MRIVQYFYPTLRFVLITTLAIGLSTLVGCLSKEEAQEKAIEEANKKAEEANAKLDRFYQIYSDGNRDQARQGLMDAVVFIENSQMPLKYQTHALWLVYSRLYVLEKKSGNDVIADANLLKARYWYLRKREVSGESVEDASQSVKDFTAEKCMGMIVHWDKLDTKDKCPNYIRELEKAANGGHH